MSNREHVGVIIVAGRAGRGMVGSIINPPWRIWIQRMTTRRGGGGGSGKEEYEEEGIWLVGGGSVSGWMMIRRNGGGSGRDIGGG